MTFKNFITESKVILTEGGVIERIRRDPSVDLDPFIIHSGLIYDEKGRDVLRKVYNEYISKNHLPGCVLF